VGEVDWRLIPSTPREGGTMCKHDANNGEVPLFLSSSLPLFLSSSLPLFLSWAPKKRMGAKGKKRANSKKRKIKSKIK